MVEKVMSRGEGKIIGVHPNGYMTVGYLFVSARTNKRHRHLRAWQRAAVCVRRPGDAHALWQRVVGVLRSMPVAGCVRVSSSVGRL
jgi:hypothetical protein